MTFLHRVLTRGGFGYCSWGIWPQECSVDYLIPNYILANFEILGIYRYAATPYSAAWSSATGAKKNPDGRHHSRHIYYLHWLPKLTAESPARGCEGASVQCHHPTICCAALQSKKGVRDTSTENCLSWCEPPVGGLRLFWDFTSPWSAFTCTVIQLRHSFVNMCNCRTPTFSHGHSTALGPHWLRLSSPTCPNKPAQSGPPGGPLAVCIHLGWAMEGPATLAQFPVEEQQCLFTVSPSLDLFQRVERCGRWICSHIQMWRLKHILRRIRKCLKFLSSTPLALR